MADQDLYRAASRMGVVDTKGPVTAEQEVVLMAYLRPILREHLADLLKKHEDDNAYVSWESDRVLPLGAVASLAFESGIPEGSIRRAIRDEHVEYVDLDWADRLCLAFGLFIECELPEEAFVNKLEALRAAREQTSMLRVVARGLGKALGSDRHAPARFKRQLAYAGMIR